MCKSLSAQGLALEKLVYLKLAPQASAEFNKIFKLISDSLEFGSFPRSRINDIRREAVLGNVNRSYSHLIATTKASDGFLFGSDLEGAMKSVELANNLSQKLAIPSRSATNSGKPFLGKRGRGRGRSKGYPDRHHQPHNSSQLTRSTK